MIRMMTRNAPHAWSNTDGKPDYMFSDRYDCPGLSANQSRGNFVLLSQATGGYKLSFAGWASYGLAVVKDPENGGLLHEQAGKTQGAFTTITQLKKGKYLPRVCVLQDDKGLHSC